MAREIVTGSMNVNVFNSKFFCVNSYVAVWCFVLFFQQKNVACTTAIEDYTRNGLDSGILDPRNIASMTKGNDWSDFQIKPAILTRSSEKKLPFFDTLTDQQVVTSPGVTAYLHCRVRNLGSKVVSWIRQKDMHILTVGIFRYTSYDYFTPLHKEGTDDWTLQISQPTSLDEGLYECQVSSSPKISRFIKLIVKDDENRRKDELRDPNYQAITSKGRRWKNDFNVEKEESEKDTVIPDAPDVYVRKGETATVTCHVINGNSPPDYIKWFHKDTEILYGPRSPRVRIAFNKGINSTSRLKVLRASKADTGRYMCLPSNSYEAYVSIHVVEENKSKVLVQSPKNSASSFSRMHLTMNLSILVSTIMSRLFLLVSKYPNG